MTSFRWEWKRFEELSGAEVYDIQVLRESIFVVEQQCPYQDADGFDPVADHLQVRDSNGQLIAYLRVLPAGQPKPTPSIGRVVVQRELRGSGLGHKLMQAGQDRCFERWPDAAITIGAQAHLERFYGALGFVACSEPYDEDGILHIDMRCETPPAKD